MGRMPQKLRIFRYFLFSLSDFGQQTTCQKEELSFSGRYSKIGSCRALEISLVQKYIRERNSIALQCISRRYCILLAQDYPNLKKLDVRECVSVFTAVDCWGGGDWRGNHHDWGKFPSPTPPWRRHCYCNRMIYLDQYHVQPVGCKANRVDINPPDYSHIRVRKVLKINRGHLFRCYQKGLVCLCCCDVEVYYRWK